MNKTMYVLMAAAVLSMSACKNETDTAKTEAAEASAAMDEAATATADAANAAEQSVDAAAAATGEAVGEAS
ncbi:MAG: hypothetical protein NTZ64_14470, partial [Polaromonas sp.]|nr:hypothetical protein [Polaromonas sp.]